MQHFTQSLLYTTTHTHSLSLLHRTTLYLSYIQQHTLSLLLTTAFALSLAYNIILSLPLIQQHSFTLLLNTHQLYLSFLRHTLSLLLTTALSLSLTYYSTLSLSLSLTKHTPTLSFFLKAQYSLYYSLITQHKCLFTSFPQWPSYPPCLFPQQHESTQLSTIRRCDLRQLSLCRRLWPLLLLLLLLMLLRRPLLRREIFFGPRRRRRCRCCRRCHVQSVRLCCRTVK